MSAAWAVTNSDTDATLHFCKLKSTNFWANRKMIFLMATGGPGRLAAAAMAENRPVAPLNRHFIRMPEKNVLQNENLFLS